MLVNTLKIKVIYKLASRSSYELFSLLFLP